MSGEVIDLNAYRERHTRPDFEGDRDKHLRERIADLDVEIALLTSERERLQRVLGSNVVQLLRPDQQT